MLYRRSEDPSDGSPLTFREVAYFLSPPHHPQHVERFLHERLAEVQREIAGSPEGRFVYLSVFDHPFQESPERPALATLHWRDWLGPARVTFGPFADAPRETAPAAPKPTEATVRPESAPSLNAPASTPSLNAPASTPSLNAPASSPASVAPKPRVPAERAGAIVPEPRMPRPETAKARTAPARVSAEPERASDQPSTPQPEATDDQDSRLATAFEATQDLPFLATPREGLGFALKLLTELIPCAAASACLYDVNSHEFRIVAALGPGAESRRAQAVPGRGGLFAAAALAPSGHLVVERVDQEPRFNPTAEGRDGLYERNMLLVRLQNGHALLGMLQLINRQGADAFTQADLAVAGYLSDKVTEFLSLRRSLAPTH